MGESKKKKLLWHLWIAGLLIFSSSYFSLFSKFSTKIIYYFHTPFNQINTACKMSITIHINKD